MGLTSLGFWYSKFSEPIHRGKRTGYQRTSRLWTTKIALKEECHSSNPHLFSMRLVRPVESACRTIPLLRQQLEIKEKSTALNTSHMRIVSVERIRSKGSGPYTHCTS